MVAAQEGHTSVLEILIHAGAHHQTQQQVYVHFLLLVYKHSWFLCFQKKIIIMVLPKASILSAKATLASSSW